MLTYLRPNLQSYIHQAVDLCSKFFDRFMYDAKISVKWAILSYIYSAIIQSYNGVLDAIQKMYKEGRIKTFYKGTVTLALSHCFEYVWLFLASKILKYLKYWINKWPKVPLLKCLHDFSPCEFWEQWKLFPLIVSSVHFFFFFFCLFSCELLFFWLY